MPGRGDPGGEAGSGTAKELRSVAATAALAAILLLAPAAVAQDDRVGQNDFGGFRNILPAGQGETVNASELGAAQAGEPPATFTQQLALYRDLLYASPRLRASDLDTFFKPAGFGVRSADIASTTTPRPGVTIVRDRPYLVPHIYGATRSDTLFGAGYASAEDRLFFMDVLRHTGRARLSELIGSGENDSTIKMDAEQLKIADYSEEELEGMIEAGVREYGAEGRQVKQDLLDYVAGINAYIAEARNDPNKLPGEYPALGKPPPEDWKPTDSVAVASLIGGIFGRGGGDEARAGEALREAERRLGRRRGRRAFQDLRRREDPEAPVTTSRRFPFDNPGRVNPRAVAAPDPGSVAERDPVAGRREDFLPNIGPGLPVPLPGGGGSKAKPASSARTPAARASLTGPAAGSWLGRLQSAGLGIPNQQSNVLLVNRRRSRSGRPIAVMGPQVGYFSPQVLMELDLHGPGIDARGAAFPGVSLYVLLGRGADFAWSATTSTADNVDEFVELLCNPDGSPATLESNHYVYKGQCRPLLIRDHIVRTSPTPLELRRNPAARPKTFTLKVERSVHGPIQGRATVRGRPVAIAEARSTYFHELNSALAFKRLNSNEVTSPSSFHRAMNNVNFAFNWFYADDRDITFFQSGWYPRRARGTDPDLPTWGTGAYDWQGFDPARYTSRRLPFRSLPKETNPRKGYIVNWNNKQAPGWRAADDIRYFSSVHRSERLEDALRAGLRRGRKLDLAGLTRIMEEGATIDLRGQEVYPWIRRVIGRSRDRELTPLLRVLDSWSRRGSHRRDLDRDNVYDESAAVALMDAWWVPMTRAIFEPRLGGPVIGRFNRLLAFDDTPPLNDNSSFSEGWWGQIDKDLRRLLGRRVRGRLSERYCGRGSLRRCRAILIATLKEAARQVRERMGPDMAGWRVPATCPEQTPKACDQIEFTAAGGVELDPIPWQDRPGFQQVVEVQGHRPRR